MSQEIFTTIVIIELHTDANYRKVIVHIQEGKDVQRECNIFDRICDANNLSFWYIAVGKKSFNLAKHVTNAMTLSQILLFHKVHRQL